MKKILFLLVLVFMSTTTIVLAQQSCQKSLPIVVITGCYSIDSYMAGENPFPVHEEYQLFSEKNTYGDITVTMNDSIKTITVVGIKTSLQGSYDLNGYQEQYACALIVYDKGLYYKILLDPDSVVVSGTKLQIINHDLEITASNIITFVFSDILPSTHCASILQTYCNIKNALHTRSLADQAATYTAWSKH